MRRIAAGLFAYAVVAGWSCGSSGTSPPPAPAGPRTASPLAAGATHGVFSMSQHVPAEDLLGEVFPGAANTWVIDQDYALSLGWGLQYAYALQLAAGITRPPADPSHAFDQLVTDWIDSHYTTALLHGFPLDQRTDEATWLGPLFSAPDGLVTAVATTAVGGTTAISGTSAFLPGGADSRLVRTLILAAGQTYTLSWDFVVTPSVGTSLFPIIGSDAPPDGPRFQVVLRDPASGAALGDPVFVETSSAPFGGSTFATFSTTPGPIPAGAVELSFEFRSGASLDALGTYAVLDAVALSTVGGSDALPNGDFETGTLAPWRGVAGREPRNVRSGARVLALDPSGATTVAVTRTFYAPPSSPWARTVDVFSNDGDAEVVTTVVYATALDTAFGGALVAWEAAAGGRAAVGRDRNGNIRDTGLVFGSGTLRIDAASVDPELAFVVHTLRVPAHGRAALVHFVVQLGQGAVLADHATTGTTSTCQAIADGFRTSNAYRDDLEPGVLGLVQNL